MNSSRGLGNSWLPNRGEDYFPDPFADYASTVMPSNMEDAHKWCFPPGVLIELGDGSLKPIESVSSGDRVLTRGRTVQSVLRTSVRDWSGDLVQVTLAGFGKNHTLRQTPGHPFFRIPVGSEIDRTFEEKVSAEMLVAGDYIATPVPELGDEVPRYDPWLVGMYVAEGCPVRNASGGLGVRFTMGAGDEASGICARVDQLLAAGTGNHREGIYTPPSRPDIRLLTSFDEEFPDWVTSRVPGLAHEKRLGPDFFSWDPMFVLPLIAGWIDGDGWVKKSKGAANGAAVQTASRVLALQMIRLANAAGLTPSLHVVHKKEGFRKGRRNKAGADQRDYVLNFGVADTAELSEYSIKLRGLDRKARSRDNGVFLKGGYLYRRIESVDREVYEGPVYNFEVEEDHTYVADGVLTCNCEYIMNNNGVYKTAVKRILSYFITEVEVGNDDTGDDEKSKYENFLNDVLQIKKILFNVGMNFITYGNAFISLVVPFRRYLYCPHCYAEHPLKIVATYQPFRFKWENYQFKAHCQNKKADGTPCGYSGAWKHVDRRTTDEKDVKVKIWSPKEIEIKYDEFSGTREYIWKIPETYKRKVREGHLHYLENANWEVVECVKSNRNLQFDDGVLYHMFEEPLAGHDTGGWGISTILANFRQAWYVQVLHRFNEAIAMDYVIPFRVITPDNSRASPGEAADPVLGINMGGFMGRVRSMLRERRKRPTEWFTLPHPIKYQVLGGEARQLAPFDLMDQGVSLLLNNIGVPAEMYKGSLTAQSAAPTLRWFEVQHTHLVHGLNTLLCKLCEMIAAALAWEPVKAKLVSPTIIDDIQDQMAKLQLMMGKQISQTTGLKALGGIDFKQEQRRILEEDRFVQEQQAKLQEEMDQAASMEQMAPPPQAGAPAVDPATGQPMAGAPPAGGAAAGPAGAAATGMQASMPMTPNTNTTPQEMLQKAQTMAEQMLSLPEGQRQSEMTKLKQADATMHALVKQMIADMRQQAQTAGGAQLLQQQFGGGGGAPAAPAMAA